MLRCAPSKWMAGRRLACRAAVPACDGEAPAFAFRKRQFRAIWIIGALVSIVRCGAGNVARPHAARAGEAHRRLRRIGSPQATTRRALRCRPRDEIGALAEDFNGLAQTLRSNEQLRRAFVADISHELRTPLAVHARRAGGDRRRCTSALGRIAQIAASGGRHAEQAGRRSLRSFVVGRRRAHVSQSGRRCHRCAEARS